MDPISDMLTIIRNAIMVKRPDVRVTYSRVKWHLLKVLEELSLVAQVEADESKRHIKFSICKTEDGQFIFSQLKRLSTPGRRLYVGWKQIPRPSGNGVIIVSTSQGLMTGHRARARKLGGELMCELS